MTPVGIASPLKSDFAKLDTPTNATASLTNGSGADVFSTLVALLFGADPSGSGKCTTNSTAVAGAEALRSPGLVGGVISTGASVCLSSGHDLPKSKKRTVPEMIETAPPPFPVQTLASAPAIVRSTADNAAPGVVTAQVAPIVLDAAATADPMNADASLVEDSSGKLIKQNAIAPLPKPQGEAQASGGALNVRATPSAYGPPLSLSKATGEGEAAPAPLGQTPYSQVTAWLNTGTTAISTKDDGDEVAATAQPTSINESTPQDRLMVVTAAPPSTIENLRDITPRPVLKMAAPLAEQLTNPIGAHLDQLRQLGSVEIRLDLHPSELGRVQLHLTMDDGRFNVRILVQDDAVKRLVDVHLAPLRARIAEMGVSVGQFDVRRDGGSSNPNRNYAPEPSLQPIQPARAGPAPARKARGPLGYSANSVDVIA